MVVAPYEVQLGLGQTVVFRAVAWDQAGNRVSVSPTWSAAGGGTIDSTGFFSTTIPGGPYAVTATAGALSATGYVWVAGSAARPIAPAIMSEPLGQTVPAGANATFSAEANGTAPLSYQWLLNGTTIAGATDSSYTRTNAQTADAGAYSVQVGNVVGTALSSNAWLTVNNPPLLAAINDQIIHAGTTLLLTNIASDSDVPAQTLTFSLEPGFPAGAVIDPATGLCAWNTTAAQAGTTNPVTVRVTDNGTPALSAAGSFTIIVVAAPTFQAMTAGTNGVTFSWSAIPGATYRIQYKDGLNDADWISLTPDVVAEGPTASLMDPIASPQRFYRVLPGP
jgi:hypothetical protein